MKRYGSLIVLFLLTLTQRGIAQQKADEARWVELITQRVLEKLREEGGWNP